MFDTSIYIVRCNTRINLVLLESITNISIHAYTYSLNSENLNLLPNNRSHLNSAVSDRSYMYSRRRIEQLKLHLPNT